MLFNALFLLLCGLLVYRLSVPKREDCLCGRRLLFPVGFGGASSSHHSPIAQLVRALH